MRLKSELWVKAYLRRCATVDVPGVVVRRGDTDAGAILIKIARLDGSADLYGPAPAGIETDDGERRWSLIGKALPEPDVDQRVANETRLDPDIWVVEIEARDGAHHLEGWLSDA